jgi:hypothetical protein
VSITDVSPSPSRYGSPVSVSVSVVGSTGLPVTGEVELSWGGSSNVVGRAPVLDGVATVTVSDLSLGRTNLAAHYLGDVSHEQARTRTGSDDVLTWGGRVRRVGCIYILKPLTFSLTFQLPNL